MHTEEFIRQHKFKVTPKRVKILSILTSSSSPLSAESIHKKMQKKVDLSTVYRTLNDFSDARMLERIDLGQGTILFEPKHDRHHHHHLFCEKCHAIEDVDVCEMEELAQKALRSARNFTNITRHSLEFYGLCKKCSMKHNK